MSRVLGILQMVGVALLLGAAGASDAGRLPLGATAVWVLAGVLMVAAGAVGRPVYIRLKARIEPECARTDKAVAFPPIDAA